MDGATATSAAAARAVTEAGGHAWRLRIAGRGAAKGSTRTAIKIEKQTDQGRVEVWGFRQDSLGFLPGDGQALVSVADGHGPSVPGTLMSQSSHLMLLPATAARRDELLTLLKVGDHKGVHTIMKDIFAVCDEKLLNTDPHTSPHPSGGATFTLNHKVLDPATGRLFTIVSNVGDSPCVKITIDSDEQKAGRNAFVVTETSEDQNCDNMLAVQRYCNMCVDLEQIPRKVILGRFNFQSPLGKRCAWMGGWGDWVEPYIYTVGDDGYYTLSDNTEVMQHFYERAPPEFKPALAAGGPQSLRSRPQNLIELAEGKFPSANYGSTLEGVLQMPFSMGDKADKIGPLHVKCVPETAVQVDDANIFEIMGTDGVMDCLPDADLARLLAEQSPEELKDVPALCDKVATLVERLAKLNWFPYSSLGVPAWDDLGFWVVQIDRVVAEAPAVDYDDAVVEDDGAAAEDGGGRPNLFGQRENTGDQDFTQDDEEEEVVAVTATRATTNVADTDGGGGGAAAAADLMETTSDPAVTGGAAVATAGSNGGGGVAADDDDSFHSADDEPEPDYDQDEPAEVEAGGNGGATDAVAAAIPSSKLKRQGTITSTDDAAELAVEAAAAAAAAAGGGGEPVDVTEDALPADILTHQST